MNLIFIFLFYFFTIILASKYDGVDDMDEYYNRPTRYLPQSFCVCKNIKKTVPLNENKRSIDVDELTWFGSIYTKRLIGDKTFFVPLCSGVLIKQNWALTSASCLKRIILPYFSDNEDIANLRQKMLYSKFLNRTLFFAAGGSKILDDIYVNQTYHRGIIRIVYNPKYNPTTGVHDLALIELHNQIAKSEDEPNIPTNIDIACLSHSQNKDYTKFSQHYFMSYQTGELVKKELESYTIKERFDNDTGFDHKKRLIDPNKERILANSTIPQLFSQVLINCQGETPDSNFYCTKSPNGKQYTSCPTDSGGALFTYDKYESRLVIVGINNMIGNRFYMEKFIMLKEDADLSFVDCGSRSFNKFTPIHDEIDWIINVIYDICLQPEMMRKYKKLCKCENQHYTLNHFQDELLKKRIANGTKVSPNDFQYSAMLFYTVRIKNKEKDGDIIHFHYLCSGTIINRHFLLTAQYCFNSEKGKPEIWNILGNEPHGVKIYYAAAGKDHSERSINNSDDQRRRIKKVHCHPNYDYSENADKILNSAFDICVVEIYPIRPFDFNEKTLILPSCLQDFDPKANIDTLKYVFAIFYVGTKKKIETRSANINPVYSRRLPSQNRYYGNRELFRIQMNSIDAIPDPYPKAENVLFASPLGNTCNGDSGSSYLRFDIRRNKFYFAGVLSESLLEGKKVNETIECKQGAISVYSSVYHNIDFIKSIIGNDACWTDNDPYFTGDN